MIPRLFHFVWVGPEAIPARYYDNMMAWRAAYPGCMFHLWADDNIHRILSEQDFAFHRRIRLMGQRADHARLHAVYRFGGVYLDMDTLPLPGRDLWDFGTAPAWAARERESFKKIGNAVFGAVPFHPWIRRMIELVPDRYDSSDWISLGPKLFTDTHADYDVRIIPTVAVYPYWYGQKRMHHLIARRLKQAYMEHLWEGTGKRTLQEVMDGLDGKNSVGPGGPDPAAVAGRVL